MNQKLNVTSLSKQVYDHLLEQMNNGAFLPGSTINISKFSEQLGVSKTPLRDALIHLELEGFVTILPRRGVRVNVLTLQDVKNAYELIGCLEATVVIQCFEKITGKHIAKLEELNAKMLEQIKTNNFKSYFQTNLAFHNVFMNLSDNELIKKTILPVKQRLYEFPTKVYISEWEKGNCGEHRQFIDYLKKKDPKGAASILKDVHWSYKVQEDYILKFHTMREEMIDQEQASRERS
ncbi:MAG: GntR family transcriptional regulator [Deltaproteobacteria bacterium]|nr:GntR family transcriptional regulator [Deltaproteobacteria bacterium]